jgi:hypothetical protein
LFYPSPKGSQNQDLYAYLIFNRKLVTQSPPKHSFFSIRRGGPGKEKKRSHLSTLSRQAANNKAANKIRFHPQLAKLIRTIRVPIFASLRETHNLFLSPSRQAANNKAANKIRFHPQLAKLIRTIRVPIFASLRETHNLFLSPSRQAAKKIRPHPRLAKLIRLIRVPIFA